MAWLVHVAKRARLLAIAIDADRFLAKRLHDEVGFHAPIVDLHARARGVEDARQRVTNGQAPSVIGKQGLRAALASS